MPFFDSKNQSWLPWILRGFLILAFLFLFIRLVELQLIKGNYFRSLSEENRIKKNILIAPRGRIIARGGEVIAGNNNQKREYGLGSVSAHITGFLGEVTKEEVGKIDPECSELGAFKLGSLIGRGGLEERYNCLLTGLDGEELVEVDTLGRTVRNLGSKNPIPGRDLRTNINFGLQKEVAEGMGQNPGAVVISDAKGEILALYSSPSFNPNDFIKENSQIEKYLRDNEKPLFNRAISGLYHPGSVFKPLVAIAALEEGKIDRNFLYLDTGFITIDSPYGKFTYSNWFFTQYRSVEGQIGLVRAIARSTDTFFYKIGEMVGIDSLVSWAEKFYLDKKTGIDVPGEVSGLIPNPIWKERVKGERWFLGNTYHMSIGQGDIALTPLEINYLTSVIANNGFLCEPRLVGKPICKDLKLKKENLSLVKEGMALACSTGGTGYPFFDFNPLDLVEDKRVGCKTGTAETGDNKTTHAWFTVFAPVEYPEIVVTVLVEKGGEGSSVAGPIARKILDYYFSQKKLGD